MYLCKYIQGSGIAIYVGYIDSRTMYVTVPIEKSLKRRLKPFQILKIAEKRTFKKLGEENTGLNYKVPSVCACVRGGGSYRSHFSLWRHELG